MQDIEDERKLTGIQETALATTSCNEGGSSFPKPATNEITPLSSEYDISNDGSPHPLIQTADQPVSCHHQLLA